MDETSASLLRRLRRPDAAAWERFVDLYTPLIYFWALRMGLQAPDAADLVQDVFATLVEKMPTFEHYAGRSFRAWLRTVTQNRWRDHCRRKAAALRGATDHGLNGVAVPDGLQDVWAGRAWRRTIGPCHPGEDTPGAVAWTRKPPGATP